MAKLEADIAVHIVEEKSEALEVITNSNFSVVCCLLVVCEYGLFCLFFVFVLVLFCTDAIRCPIGVRSCGTLRRNTGT